MSLIFFKHPLLIIYETTKLQVRNYSKLFNLVITFSLLGSCTVTNNLYVANPNPMGKGKEQAYFGISTGVQAKIDSVNKNNGNINFSNKISTAPVLSFGGQFGISNQTDARVAVHLPKIIGGFGIRAGLQHSFLDSNSKLNFALGFDLGGVFSKDSIKFFGSNTAVDKETNGALNADFFIPFSVNFKKEHFIIITPRYSFNTFFIRENQFNEDDRNFNFGYPALSIGIMSKKYYFEATALYYYEKLYPQFGFARLINF